jgi:DNA ligase 4
LSISQVDDLLDELASNSGFSDVSIHTKYPRGVRRGRLPLLKSLFRTLSPIDASFLTHIILKDLRPILYPLQETHYTTALTSYNTTSVQMLTKEHAMLAWDPTGLMLRAYFVRSTINAAATYFELHPHQREANIPRIGIPVEVTRIRRYGRLISD